MAKPQWPEKTAENKLQRKRNRTIWVAWAINQGLQLSIPFKEDKLLRTRKFLQGVHVNLCQNKLAKTNASEKRNRTVWVVWGLVLE